MANQYFDTSVTAIGALEMDSALPSRNAKFSDSQNHPLALTLGRTESIYNATALAVDWMEQANRFAVLVAEQMGPYVRAVALAAEQMVPYVCAVALVAEQIVPYVRAVARTASQLEPAINSLAMATIVQKRSTLNERAIEKANVIAATEQELFVSEYEVLDGPLVLPSVSDTQHVDSKDRYAVFDPVLWLEPKAFLGGIETLEYRLANIDPDLPNMLLGARAALKTPNPDRARHVIVSLRELVTHVLHRLAPDESLRTWTNDASLFENGRPTREARLLYIHREIRSGILSKPIDFHVKGGIALIRILNRETHVASSRLTDKELLVLFSATESLLHFILRPLWSRQSDTTETM